MKKTGLVFSIQSIYCFESHFTLEMKMDVNTYLLTVSKDCDNPVYGICFSCVIIHLEFCIQHLQYTNTAICFIQFAL